MPQKPRVVRSESALTKETLSNLLQENRRFDPPPELAAHANVTADAYAEAAEDRLAFWERAAERGSRQTVQQPIYFDLPRQE